MRIVRRWPRKAFWIQTRTLQADGEPFESLRLVFRSGDVDDLKFPLDLQGQVFEQRRTDEDRKDFFAQLIGNQKFRLTPA